MKMAIDNAFISLIDNKRTLCKMAIDNAFISLIDNKNLMKMAIDNAFISLIDNKKLNVKWLLTMLSYPLMAVDEEFSYLLLTKMFSYP